MMRKLYGTLIAGLLLGGAPLAAQSANAGGSAQTRIDVAMAAAARAHIPASLIENKVAEGEAKGVARDRIAAAVEARVAALMRASEAMRRADVEPSSAGELSVVADALEAGISESAVIQITRDAPAERRAVAVAVLADLVRLGSSTDQALVRLSGAIGSSAALANLHAEVASQLRLGGLSSTAEAAGLLHIR